MILTISYDPGNICAYLRDLLALQPCLAQSWLLSLSVLLLLLLVFLFVIFKTCSAKFF